MSKSDSIIGYMKFEHHSSPEVFQLIKQDVQEYFKSNGISKYANWKVYLKNFILFSLFLGSYLLIYFTNNLLVQSLLYIVMGLTSVMLVFNLVHDAIHNALSRNKKVNYLLRYIGDLLGINTYIWKIRHNRQHHNFANVVGGDLIFDKVNILRLSPHQPAKRFHKYQPYYAPVLYTLYSIYLALILDFVLFFNAKALKIPGLMHPKREWHRLLFFKLIYLTYMVALPIIFGVGNWYEILGLFLLMHMSAGILLSLSAVLNHYAMGVAFPEHKNGVINSNWSDHQVHTTIDFAANSKTINWVTGGLNTHVVHHLFPDICHIHYFHLTNLIRKRLSENDCFYRNDSLREAIRSHFQYLHKLANLN